MFSDLLRRHIRIYHPRREPLPSRVQKACSACHARKERCHGGFPCSACEKRGVLCLSRDRAPEEPRAVDANVEMTPSHRVRRPSPAPAESSIPSPPASGPPRWVAQGYVDIYFREFHPIWPFLHRGTFDLPHEPCILIQSIVMIGLWIEGGQKSRDAARDLHRSLCAAIHSQMVRLQRALLIPRGRHSLTYVRTVGVRSILPQTKTRVPPGRSRHFRACSCILYLRYFLQAIRLRLT